MHSPEFETHRLLAHTAACATYEATHLPTNERVVLTVDLNSCESSDLRWEAKVLKDLFGCPGVPRLVWEGEVAGRVAFAVKEYGQSLLSFVHTSSPVAVGVLLKVAVSLLKTLEAIHERGYLHLSVNPENVRLSPSGESLYLCGLRTAASNLMDGRAGKFKGDPVFAATEVLTGGRPTRKDDLESLSYVLSFVHAKTLPWALAQSPNEVLAIRSRPAGKQLMADLPVEFHNFHSYVTSLDHEKQPNYHTLRRRFREAAKRLNVAISLSDLWVRKKYSRRASESMQLPCLCPTATAPFPEISEIAQHRIQTHHTTTAGVLVDLTEEQEDGGEDESEEATTMTRSETVKKLLRPALPNHLRKSRLTL